MFLGKGDRAGVDIEIVVAEGGNGQHVRVSVNQNVTAAKGRRRLGIVVMPVGDKEGSAFLKKEHIVGENGEVQHHLVDLGVAVSADTAKDILAAIKQGDDFLGCVVGRQVVARSVIKQVAQEDHFVRALLVVKLEKALGAFNISVNVGGK